jgi:glycosyltransferase involved in cell wall biosynthesis
MIVKLFMHPIVAKPTILIVGGPDVDARIELMQALRDEFSMAAAGSSPQLRQRFAQTGLDYFYYPLSRGSNPFMDIYTAISLWRLFRRLRPHVVHTFDTKPGVWGPLAAWFAKVPIIIVTITGFGGALYVNDNISTRIVRAIYQHLQKLACHVSNLSIFQHQENAQECIDARIVTKQTAIVIPGSGVSTDVFAPVQVPESIRNQVRAELGVQPAEIVVTMISRVIRSKGVLEFMAAAQEMGIRYPNARFLLIGPEDEESVDRLNAAELTQLKQVVTWPGPRRDIPTVLALSDIFVFPSAYREGIPRVLLEAASMGLPIITTDSPGCNEVVEHGVNGFLVPVCDSQALGKAISCLIEQPELRRRFGRISRQWAIERFDLSVVADQTRSAYQQLLARKALLPAMES